ncbi:hypothetical protein [Methylorubrum extorquens]
MSAQAALCQQLRRDAENRAGFGEAAVERVLIDKGYQNLFRFLGPGPAVYGGARLTSF